MAKKVISIEHVGKKYRLGAINTGTLADDIKLFVAEKMRHSNGNSIKTNKDFWALKNINLEVLEGDTLGIIGMNGAGKSTLLKILSRITSPTEGKITIDGRISSMLEVGTGFHKELTGRENIYLNGAILGMSKKEIDRKMEQIIEFSECEDFIDTPVKRYSSGMYVKLAFSVAAHLDSEIMIMDEVLAVGDAKFQEKCLGKMGDEAHRANRTVLYVSHNMNTIRKLCNRCIVLEHGEKIYDGNVEDAIQLYVNKSFALSAHHKLETGYAFCSEKIKMLRLDVVGNETCIFSPNENLCFTFSLESFLQSTHVHFRFIVKREDDEPLGTFVSGEVSLEKNRTHTFSVSLPLKNIPDGKYSIKIAVSSVNSFGTHEGYGNCPRALNFIVQGGRSRYLNLDWVYWGWGAYFEGAEVYEC